MANRFVATDTSHEEGYVQTLVVSGCEDPEYYGTNVLFYEDGRIEGCTADPVADKEWAEERSAVIDAARRMREFG